MKIFILILSLILSFSMFAEAKAKNSKAIETPTKIDGVKEINVAEVKEHIKKGTLIVDTRKKLEYNQGHINTAVLISYKDRGAKVKDFDPSKDKFKIAKLEKALGGVKTKTFIMYCNGKNCWQSYKSIIWAKKEGFTNPLWFRGGVPDWKAAGNELVK